MKLFFLPVIAALAGQVFAANNFYGIAGANSIGGSASYVCRTQAQWNKVATDAKTNGFKSIRLVGFDCDALHRASRAAVASGLKIMAGIYIPGSVASARTQVDTEVQVFVAAYRQFGAGVYDGLTIGNEVNDSAANIMAKVYSVRGYLRSLGISTPVSTVHTWVRIRDEPALCGADFVAANAHAFFDPNQPSGKAGDVVFQYAIPALKSRCPGKKVVITESGWPSAGNRNGAAIASWSDERNALLNLNCACTTDRSVQVYAFEIDDQVWKHNANERSFGIFGKIGLNSDIFKIC
ncbi:glycoside hydrolase superfamily [Crassisporium funariophilum]|nr:glycoside hydrolase superfamily [Crassisporium funariophilum]